MLYDRKWDRKITRAEPSLPGLIKWLENQPAETEYDWFHAYPVNTHKQGDTLDVDATRREPESRFR
jgi:hypothetical protein